MTRYNMAKANGMGEVYSRANRLAHQLATFEEMRLRGAILSQVEAARTGGANTSQLLEILQRIEVTGKMPG